MPVGSSKPAKRQTRLQFSPLPSSPPAKESYFEAIQDRSANIRHDFAGHKRTSTSREEESRILALPTPENSSQPVIQIKDGTAVLTGCPYSLLTGCAELQASSPLSDPPTSPVSPLAAAIPIETARSELSSKADSVSNDIVSSRRRATQTVPSNGRPSDIHVASNASPPAAVADDEEEDDIPLPSAKRQRIQPRMSDRRKAKVTPRRSARLQPAPRPSSNSSQSTTSSQRFVAVEIPSPAMSVLGSAETTGDEDDIIVTSPTKRKRPQKAPRDNFVVNDDRIDYYSSEGEVVTPSKPRRRAQNKPSDDFVLDDDRVDYFSSDDGPVTPSKRQKLSRSQLSPQKELRWKAELEEDLEDLADSDNVVKKNRTRGAPVNKAREETRKHLEILKRRRAGEKVPHILETEDGDEEDPIDVDRVSRSAPRYSLPSGQSSADSSEDSDLPPENTNIDEDEDDFIVDDSAEQIGMPHAEIPLEFTSYASRKPRELFVHVIDWLVKNKISPAFDRHNPIWELAFRKLDDEVKGQAGSRLISAAWNEPFVRTLVARPGLTAVHLPGDEADCIRTCDACNRTNHPAQYDFQFSGKAYYHKTLEPVDSSDEEDEDNENDAASMDSKNHVLPSSHQHFYLGRYCAANAEMGHKLSHWLFHLNQNLLTYLEEQGVLSAENIIARDKKNHTKREREAETIVDTMRETGVVDDLWRDFKSDMDDARTGMDGFEKKGGRGKARIGSIRVQKQDDDGEVMWEGDVRGERVSRGSQAVR
jgi:hypothetical protein